MKLLINQIVLTIPCCGCKTLHLNEWMNEMKEWKLNEMKEWKLNEMKEWKLNEMK
jgi:hypothetical protein